MRKSVTEINPISPRANAKSVQVGTRQFLIGMKSPMQGGMTADKVSVDIYEFKAFND